MKYYKLDSCVKKKECVDVFEVIEVRSEHKPIDESIV